MAAPKRENKPCRAAFRIGCVIMAPMSNDTWMPIGTINDNFICQLVSDPLNNDELKLEVNLMIKEFKEKWKDVLTLEQTLKTAAQELLNAQDAKNN